jgi:SAM-dependent methyltransferase
MNAAPMAEPGARTSPPPPLKCAELDVPRFTAHNIRLDDGTLTKPEAGETIDRHPWFLAAKRILDATCQGPRNNIRLLDLGCLEGGYSVEFARLGYRTVGLDVREANIAACRYVQSRIRMEALEFVQDDAWNVAQYGEFDATFCCGLLYHLDKPREFLRAFSFCKRIFPRPRTRRRGSVHVDCAGRSRASCRFATQRRQLIVFRAWWKTKASLGVGSQSFGISERIAIARIVGGRPGTTVSRFGSSGSI